MRWFCLIFVLNICYAHNWQYWGIAKDKKGHIVYKEYHLVELSQDGQVLKAQTQYKDDKDNLIALLSSDFSRSLTAPVYDFKDLRIEELHGVRYEGEEIVLYKKSKNKNEEIKKLGKEKDENILVVGCQGLHYYLQDNLNQVRNKKNIPLKFLIPGDLDSYHFKMETKEDQAGLLNMEIKVSTLFLRLFAPKLIVQYNPETKKLVKYEGLSNIKDARGRLQNVTIEYIYEKN